MSIKWKNEDKGIVKSITSELEKIKKINGVTGEVSLHNPFRLDDWLTVLINTTPMSKEIPGLEKKRIIYKAIFEAGRKGKITIDSLSQEISALQSNYLKTVPLPYVLVTSLSLESFQVPPKKTRFEGSTVTFSHDLPRSFQKDRISQEEQWKSSLFKEVPKDYIYVRVRVSARSENEAVDTALDCLELLRGIWNFYFNWKHSGERSIPWRPKPLNKITLGPLHTLHRTSGKLATENVWYDPSYKYPLKTILLKDRSLFDFEKNVRKCLAASYYGEILKDAVRRYGRALDYHDWNVAFMKLWNVLEFLTKTKNADYKITIRRAAFILKDKHFHTHILNHLRNYRNNLMHADVDNSEIETYVYQLKRYVEALLKFHLWYKPRFKSIQEAATFLDQATDINVLNSKIDMLKSAKKFLTYKP